MQVKAKKRFAAPEVHILWGPTRTGKTARAWNEILARGIEEDYILDKMEETQWFDGLAPYMKAMVWDEIVPFFETERLLKLMMRVIDRYPLTVNVKSHRANFNVPLIYLTSNHDPEHWFDTMPLANIEAWRARLKEFCKIRHITTPYVHPTDAVQTAPT